MTSVVILNRGNGEIRLTRAEGGSNLTAGGWMLIVMRDGEQLSDAVLDVDDLRRLRRAIDTILGEDNT